MEAVLFGLFGDVPGVNKQDLVPLGGGGLRVTVVFSSPYTGKKVRVHREGALTKSGGFRTSKAIMEVEGEEHPYTREHDIQSKLRELLGVGKNVFFNVVYARQKEFVDILNPPRTRMDAILGLTTPAEIREQLREVKRMLEIRGGIDERGAVEERIGNAETVIEDCEKQLKDVRARKDQLSDVLREKMAELSVTQKQADTLESLVDEFKKLDRKRNELEILRSRREDRDQDLQVLYEALGERPEDFQTELLTKRQKAKATEERLRKIVDEELGGERRKLDGSIARLEHQIREHVELKKEGVTVCPKCGQRVDYELIEEDLAKWEKELEDEKERLVTLQRELKEVQDQVNATRESRLEVERSITRFIEQNRRIEELKKAVQQLDSQGAELTGKLEKETGDLLQQAETELATAFASLDDAQRRMEDRLKTIRRELAHLEGDVRSSKALLEVAERREKELELQIKTYGETLEESRKLLTRILEYEAKTMAVERIQRQYGEYEQQLRENTLRQLEWLTYKYFERLTDQQVYAGCHIDRERYVLEVQPIGSKRLLPAWRAGGGHESLFALAERLALLRVMGFPHLLILDEPTDAVDSDNVPQLLEYIARSSREIGQVLLVTHHGHGEEEGVNIIRVRKVDGESRVYQETPSAD